MRALFEAWAKPHYLYRPVQLLRRIARGLARPGAREIVALPWGLDLIVDPREAIGSALWHLGVFDLALTETLWRLLEPGDLALDVGANIGYTTGLMALRVGSTGRVLAFEPHPAVHAQLVANAERARRNPRCGEIRTFETALGAVTGVARLAPGSYFADNNGIARLTDEPDVEAIEVALTTLDEALGDGRAALVKIDVEGEELRVLRGAARALGERRIRHLVFESYPAELPGVAAWLGERGYSLFGLGMRWSGLLLSRPGEEPRLPPYEAPNYLATLDPVTAASQLRGRGWQALRGDPGRARPHALPRQRG
ncbi:MAG TPA: FkbM family methyltransferase [Thermoanaerobaculia bacterium]|nr:FkbM family methyltransferase [Thermoanaerobaculia bacterium]